MVHRSCASGRCLFSKFGGKLVGPASLVRGHDRHPTRRGIKVLAELQGVSALCASEQLALARAKESAHDQPLFLDPWAADLAGGSAQSEASTSDQAVDDRLVQLDVIATKYIDECLLQGVSLTHEQLGDYRQVVLLGCGLDTRAHRLPWPSGTIIFEIAPSEVHRKAEAVLKVSGASVPRGCLLRRVNANVKLGEPFEDALQLAGFRGDRLSVWGLQGLACMGLSQHGLAAALSQVVNMAAFQSLVIGELPDSTRAEAQNLLGNFGLLGSVAEFGDPEASYGRWLPEWTGEMGGRQRHLFATQHQRRSVRESEIYEAHLEAAADTDEDFLGNFS